VGFTIIPNPTSWGGRATARGRFPGNRIIDLAHKTATLLGFRGHGLAKVKVEYVGRAPLTGSDDRKLMATLREGAPAQAPVQVASSKGFAPAYFDSRPMSRLPATVPPPPDRPFRMGEGGQEVAAADLPAPKAAPTFELAANARPTSPAPAARAPAYVPPSVSPVSAYAPTRYDGQAGLLSGRGLY
jgi:rare lipoprotein A